MDPAAAKPASDLLTSAGIIAVLGAVGLLATTIITALAATKAKAQIDRVKEMNDGQTQMLTAIKALVDGRFGEVLQELANMKWLMASTTGSPMDTAAAVSAQEAANAQQERTRAVTEALAAGNGVKPEAPKP